MVRILLNLLTKIFYERTATDRRKQRREQAGCQPPGLAGTTGTDGLRKRSTSPGQRIRPDILHAQIVLEDGQHVVPSDVQHPVVR